MKKHVRLYMQSRGFRIGDFIPCEDCGKEAVDIHHRQGRGMGGRPSMDVASNLIALCRSCHERKEMHR